MTEREQQRVVSHRLAVLRHAEEVTGADWTRSSATTAAIDGNVEVARIPVGEPTDSTLRTTIVHIGRDRVWADNGAERQLYEIDPATNEVVGVFSHLEAWTMVAFP